MRAKTSGFYKFVMKLKTKITFGIVIISGLLITCIQLSNFNTSIEKVSASTPKPSIKLSIAEQKGKIFIDKVGPANYNLEDKLNKTFILTLY